MIKDIIKKITTPQQRVKAERTIRYALSHKKKINIASEYECIKHKNADVFFGYYDINPFSNKRMLYLIVANNKCFIILNYNGVEETIGKTSSWCWQQGCRLRWYPNNDNVVIWNDFDGSDYCSMIYNIRTKETKKLTYPLYDISSNGKYGVVLDFNRLGYMRPGYGYTNKMFDLNDTINGIVVLDMNSFSVVKNITYDMVMKFIPEQLNVDDCYFNHLSFSPDGEKLLFFYLTKGKIHKARLFVYDIITDGITPLELVFSVSHYCWLDGNTILATAYDENRNCGYYLYDIYKHTRVPFLGAELKEDGHPTLMDGGLILTDTYPDSNGFQKVMIIDKDSNTISVIAELYSTARCLGEKRTDLHPRFDSTTGQICVDTNTSGKRQIINIKR